jgi:hypothetical protein
LFAHNVPLKLVMAVALIVGLDLARLALLAFLLTKLEL